MKKVLITIWLAFSLTAVSQAQDIALKSNLLYDATATINLGLEVGLAPKWTLEVPVNFHPWKFQDGARFRHWLIQPEIRYWFCERFNRGFIGLQAHYADFNVGGWPDWSFISDNMQASRYEGFLYGGGLTIGYSWILNSRWSLEATFGLGYARIEYDKYPCAECGSQEKEDRRNYFGPTEAGVSLIYLIK